MIRTMEIGIQRRTAALNKQVAAKELPAEQAKAEHGKLGRRQDTVRKITEQLKSKITKQSSGGGGGGGPEGGF